VWSARKELDKIPIRHRRREIRVGSKITANCRDMLDSDGGLRSEEVVHDDATPAISPRHPARHCGANAERNAAESALTSGRRLAPPRGESKAADLQSVPAVAEPAAASATRAS
jgi:hypothetical protein